MRKFILTIIIVLFATTTILAQGAKPEIEKHQKAGKIIFVIVTDKTAKGVDAMQKIALNAQKSAKNTAIVKLLRDDKANTDLIVKYKIIGLHLPLLLVVGSNDVVSGILNSTDATEKKLLSFIPTKTQADVLLGFDYEKPALVICGKKNAKDKGALEIECKKATYSLGNKVTNVFVDVDSKEEKNFLALLKPNPKITTLYVFNGKGLFTETLDAKAKAKEIFEAATKKVNGGCPGSTK